MDNIIDYETNILHTITNYISSIKSRNTFTTIVATRVTQWNILLSKISTKTFTNI